MHNLFKLLEFFKKFPIFLCVGFVGFFIDLLVFFISVRMLGGSLAIGRACASLVAIITTWLLNSQLTFSDRRSLSIRREFFTYLFLSAVGAFANYIALEWVARFDEGSTHLLAYLSGALVGLFINYLLYNLFVFKKSNANKIAF